MFWNKTQDISQRLLFKDLTLSILPVPFNFTCAHLILPISYIQICGDLYPGNERRYRDSGPDGCLDLFLCERHTCSLYARTHTHTHTRIESSISRLHATTANSECISGRRWNLLLISLVAISDARDDRRRPTSSLSLSVFAIASEAIAEIRHIENTLRVSGSGPRANRRTRGRLHSLAHSRVRGCRREASRARFIAARSLARGKESRRRAVGGR